MEAAFLLLFALSNASPSWPEPCASEHSTYISAKNRVADLEIIDNDVARVAITTAFSYVIYIRKSDFIEQAQTQKRNHPNLSRTIDRLLTWLGEQGSGTLVNLDHYEGGQSNRVLYLAMGVAESRALDVRRADSKEIVKGAVLEWYTCSEMRGGRRLRTESGSTIFWTFDWII